MRWLLPLKARPAPPLRRARPPRRALMAAGVYGVLVLGLFVMAGGALSDVLARRAALAQERETLDRLLARRPAGPAGASTREAGGRFLQGPSLTVAGAALMERLSAAAEKAGGRLSSSRLDVESHSWGPGVLSAEATLDIAEPDLQRLLYDLEAGMPFLYVERLAIQGGAADSGANGRLKITLTLSGLWQGAL